MDLNLNGKVAVVCGSTQGIGYAAALELAQLGARVFLMARNEDKLKEAVATLPSPSGAEHGYLVADFSHPTSDEECIKGFTTKHKANILINNTGGPNPGPAIDSDIGKLPFG
jgi:3-oxoacyl-[acyl-carrier protein] reductase